MAKSPKSFKSKSSPAQPKAAFPKFRRQVIWSGPPAERTSCVVGDLNGDGVPEIVISQRRPKPEAMWLGRTAGGRWEPHLIDNTFASSEAGGCLAPIARSGRLDLILACDWSNYDVYWWECPPDPTQPWTRRTIWRMPGRSSHDQMVADLDGDGRSELYFWNQETCALFCVPFPDDPRAVPWSGVKAVDGGLREEGLCYADMDGDGRNESIAALNWYRRLDGGIWECHPFARGFVSPKSVVADFDGDGRPEIVISEGDASLNGREFGRVVLFKAGKNVEDLWEPHLLHDRLLEPHSLQVADFDGDGRPDLFVGEMGLPNGENPHSPAMRIWQNLGGGRFEEHVIDEGVGTHEAKTITLDGRMGIAGKPYRGMQAKSREVEADCVHLWMPE